MKRDLLWGIGSHNYGGWRVPRSAFCWKPRKTTGLAPLQTQGSETRSTCVSQGQQRQMCHLSSAFCFPGLSDVHHIAEGDLFHSVSQFKFWCLLEIPSPSQTCIEIILLLPIWASLRVVNLTHRTNHRSRSHLIYFLFFKDQYPLATLFLLLHHQFFFFLYNLKFTWKSTFSQWKLSPVH